MAKKILINFLLITGFILFLGFFVVSSASAQGTIIIEPKISGTIADVIDRVIDFLIKVAVPLTVIMVLVGSFQMLVSGGNAEQFRKGTKTIIYAAVGFMVVLLAKGSTSLIKELITGSS